MVLSLFQKVVVVGEISDARQLGKECFTLGSQAGPGPAEDLPGLSVASGTSVIIRGKVARTDDKMLALG
jgi:hypothetical protein